MNSVKLWPQEEIRAKEEWRLMTPPSTGINQLCALPVFGGDTHTHRALWLDRKTGSGAPLDLPLPLRVKDHDVPEI